MKKEDQQEENNNIMNIELNVIPGRVSIPRALRLEAHNFIYDTLPVTCNVQHKKKSDRNKFREAKKQLGLAITCIMDHKLGRNRIRSFRFDWVNMDDDDEREYLFIHMGDIVKELCDIAELNSKWVVKYSFDDRSIKTCKLNFDIAPLLIRQLEKENFLDTITDEFSVYENDEYDFFPVEIKELKYLEFVDVAIKSTSKNKRNEAGFWRWVLNLPLNLSDYQIFNALNERTVNMMIKDNCIIYACIKSGISDDIINHMRDVFRNRFISLNKLETIGNECDIKFTIRYDIDRECKKVAQVGNKDGKEIKLVLVNEHYMIDKDIAMSPYYIKHWREINIDNNVKHWTQQQKYLIGGISNGLYYVRQNSYDIVEVIRKSF